MSIQRFFYPTILGFLTHLQRFRTDCIQCGELQPQIVADESRRHRTLGCMSTSAARLLATERSDACPRLPYVCPCPRLPSTSAVHVCPPCLPIRLLADAFLQSLGSRALADQLGHLLAAQCGDRRIQRLQQPDSVTRSVAEDHGDTAVAQPEQIQAEASQRLTPHGRPMFTPECRDTELFQSFEQIVEGVFRGHA